MAEGGVLATIERHPYVVAGGIFIVGAILIYYFLGSSRGAVVDNSGFYAAQAAAIQSGNALQAAQIAGQVQSAGFQQAVNREAIDASAAIALAHISAGSADYLAARQTDVAFRGYDTTDRTNILAAEVASRNIDAGRDVANYGAQQQTQQQQIASDTIITTHAADIGLYTLMEQHQYDLNAVAIPLAAQVAISQSADAAGVARSLSSDAASVALGQSADAASVARSGIEADASVRRTGIAANAAVIAAEHQDIVNSVTSSYQNIGNYQYADYINQLTALAPGGSGNLSAVSTVPPSAGQGFLDAYYSRIAAGGFGPANAPFNFAGFIGNLSGGGGGAPQAAGVTTFTYPQI